MKARLAGIIHQTRKPHLFAVTLTSGLLTGSINTNNERKEFSNVSRLSVFQI